MAAVVGGGGAEQRAGRRNEREIRQRGWAGGVKRARGAPTVISRAAAESDPSWRLTWSATRDKMVKMYGLPLSSAIYVSLSARVRFEEVPTARMVKS